MPTLEQQDKTHSGTAHLHKLKETGLRGGRGIASWIKPTFIVPSLCQVQWLLYLGAPMSVLNTQHQPRPTNAINAPSVSVESLILVLEKLKQKD